MEIVENGGRAYFTFTPETNGTYVLSSSDNAGKSTFVELKEAETGNTLDWAYYNYGSGKFSLQYKMTAGTTYL